MLCESIAQYSTQHAEPRHHTLSLHTVDAQGHIQHQTGVALLQLASTQSAFPCLASYCDLSRREQVLKSVYIHTVTQQYVNM